MKRFYSLIAIAIMALVSLTTSAQVKSLERSLVGAKQAEGTLKPITAAKHDVSTVARIAKAVAMEKTNRAVPTAKKAPKKVMDVTGDTWTSLGTGTYTDDFLNAVFSSAENFRVDVEIEESNEHPGVYRLLNPYKAIQATWGGGRYDDSEDHHMIIHTEDGDDAVWMEHFHSGLYPNDAQNYGEFYVMSYPQYFVEGGQAADIPTVAGYGWCGTISNGTINLGSENYFCQLLEYSTTNGWTGNKNGGTQITLPGVEVKDYSVKLTSLSCQDDNSIAFELELGADVASAKFGIFGGRYSASEGNLSYVAQSGNDIEAGAQAYNLTNAEMGTYTVMVAGLDADGNVVGGAACYTYINADDNDNWTSLGTTMYGEDIIATYYGLDVEEYEVEIQQNNETPGFYRLVNPYAAATGWKYAQYNEHSEGHNHYIYIHAENPEQIWIDESAIGFDSGDGVASVCSYAVNFTDASDEDWGYYEDNKIVFPAKGLVISEANYNNGKYALTNQSAGFYVVDPTVKVAPVKEITIDFTAQGWENAQKITELTQDGIALTFSKGANTNNNTDPAFFTSGNALRLYAKNTMNIKAVDARYTAIKQIVFTTGSGSYVINAGSTWSEGTYDSGTKTWTGNTLDLTLTEGGTSGHARLQQMVISVDYDNIVEAEYTVTPVVNEAETELTAVKFSGLEGLSVGTGVITVAKGELVVAEFDVDALVIENGELTLTLENAIVGPAEVTITVPQGAFMQEDAEVKEKIVTVTLNEVVEPTPAFTDVNGNAIVDGQAYLLKVGGKFVVDVDRRDAGAGYRSIGVSTAETAAEVATAAVVANGGTACAPEDGVDSFVWYVETLENGEVIFKSGMDYYIVRLMNNQNAYGGGNVRANESNKENATPFIVTALDEENNYSLKFNHATHTSEGYLGVGSPYAGISSTPVACQLVPYVPAEPAANLVYEANGVVGDGQAVNTNMPFFNTAVKVEAYDDNTIVIKAWDGVEGSDLKIAYAGIAQGDEVFQTIIGIEQTVNGEVVSEVMIDDEDEDMSYVALLPQAGDYNTAAILIYNEMTGIRLENEDGVNMGQLSLYGMWFKGDAGFSASDELHYMVTWPAEPVVIPEPEPELVYTANGVVGDGQAVNTNMPFFNTAVKVEAYDNDCIVIKAWDGVEGSDLKVYYAGIQQNEESFLAIIGLEQTVNGEVVSEVVMDEDEDPEAEEDMSYVTLYPQSETYPIAAILIRNEMTGIRLESEDGVNMGQLSLYGAWYVQNEEGDVDPGFGMGEPTYLHYMVTWPAEPVVVVEHQFDPDKLYNLGTARGYLPASEEMTDLWGANYIVATADVATAGKFQLRGEAGNITIYNADVKKYLSADGTPQSVYVDEADGTFSIVPATEVGGNEGAWIIKSNVTGKWMMFGGSKQFLNNDGWNAADDGDQWFITEAPAVAGPADLHCDYTLNEGNTVATVTVEGLTGTGVVAYYFGDDLEEAAGFLGDEENSFLVARPDLESACSVKVTVREYAADDAENLTVVAEGVILVEFPYIDVAVNAINAANSNVIFNMMGQKMNRLQKGINIVNGKKLVVK